MTARFRLPLALHFCLAPAFAFLLSLLVVSIPTARSDDTADDKNQTEAPADPGDVSTPEEKKAEDKFKPLPPPRGLVRLAKDQPVWADFKRKLVIVDGRVALREGQLEMFACPAKTKEHESIVVIDSKALPVHAGLLAIGGKVGKPVQFDPEYVAASGMEVEVLVLWKDLEGKKHSIRAQEWIKNVKTGKAMEYNWVFAGSGFWTDEQSGKRLYHADGGDFICVSNFPTAMLDLPIKSSAETAGLLFGAFTKNIPPKGTHVRLVLKPKLPVAKKPVPGKTEKPADKKSPAG